MGIRQRLNDNPLMAGGIAAVCVVLMLVVLMWSRIFPPGRGKAAGITQEFFSVDDGKTWFADDANKLPPFDHDGKPAYRARVYRCPHGKEFVSHLERYNDADLAHMKSLIEQGKTRTMEFARLGGEYEAKRPGGKEWVKVTQQNAARANALRSPKCPEGSTSGLIRLNPS